LFHFNSFWSGWRLLRWLTKGISGSCRFVARGKWHQSMGAEVLVLQLCPTFSNGSQLQKIPFLVYFPPFAAHKSRAIPFA
jgi:hypothetical protein